MTKHALAIFSALGIVGLGSVAGCSGPPTDAAPDGKPASSVVAEEKSDFDRDGYCSAVCERSASCGLEQATSLAGKVDQAALDRAKQKREGDLAECVGSCGKSQLPPYLVAQAKSALACTKKESCDAYATCLEGVATQ